MNPMILVNLTIVVNMANMGNLVNLVIVVNLMLLMNFVNLLILECDDSGDFVHSGDLSEYGDTGDPGE